MTIAARLLDVIEHDILPLTAKGVDEGNKVFGAAILKKSDLSLVIAETNNELENELSGIAALSIQSVAALIVE